MKTRGFTLIEAMIIVAIVGILAAIAIPNFYQFKERRKAQQTPKICRTGPMKTWIQECAIHTSIHVCTIRADELFCEYPAENTNE